LTLSGSRFAGTRITKASWRPSGDQARLAGASSRFVTRAVTFSLNQCMWICAPLASAATKASRAPSGDHRGLDWLASLPASGWWSFPSRPMSQIAPRRLSVFTSKERRT
jgi:hypothetical protein